VDYYSIFAKRYDELAGERTDRVLPHVKLNITTPRMDIDEIPGNKVDYSDLLNRNDGSRLLLQGRPGCGKSRLMKQVSR
jgi:ABC-type uncharacterized transport system fused permease/ATPase subunit